MSSTDQDTRQPPPVQAPWALRILAVLSYLGFAPLFWPSKRLRRSTFLAFHDRQAMVIWGLFALTFSIFMVSVAFFSYLLINQRSWYEGSFLEQYGLWSIRKLLVAWAVVWLFGATLPLGGRLGLLPIFDGMTQWRRWIVASRVFNVVLLATFLVAACFTVHGTLHFRNAGQTGKAYMLYDNLGFWPRSVFVLGFYRIGLAAEDKWGPGSVVVEPLNTESFNRAMEHGTFVFVSSHGTDAGLRVHDGEWIKPVSVREPGVNPDLSFVYLTGCDSGADAAAWENALRPARVRSFDRLSAIIEHIIWLWTKGPGEVASV